MAVSPPVCDFGWEAAPFALPATDGRTYEISDIAGPKGTLVMFICNHCPYVLSVLDRMIQDIRDVQALGIGVAAICSNDPQTYPADSFENMAMLAEKHGFPFPYLHDADQSVARAYAAACTPDFFGFNADLQLQYRGRLDDAGRGGTEARRRELYEAMRLVAETGKGPVEQVASMGCSIKWKPAA